MIKMKIQKQLEAIQKNLMGIINNQTNLRNMLALIINEMKIINVEETADDTRDETREED